MSEENTINMNDCPTVDIDVWEYHGDNASLVIGKFLKMARRARWTREQTEELMRVIDTKKYDELFEYLETFT